MIEGDYADMGSEDVCMNIHRDCGKDSTQIWGRRTYV